MALAIFGSFFFALRDAAPRARSGRPGAAGPFGSIVRSATPLMRATVNFFPDLLSFFCSGPVPVSWSTRQAFRPAATNQQHFESLSGVRRRILGGPPVHRPTDGCFSLCPGLFFPNRLFWRALRGAPPSGEPPARADCFEKKEKEKKIIRRKSEWAQRIL